MKSLIGVKQQGERKEHMRYIHQSRMSESDPLGFYAGDTNLYRYVGDDPTNATDPSGLIKHSDQDFWNTEYGKGFWKDIELGASGLKVIGGFLIREATRIDSDIKHNGDTKDFVKRMQYILDNVDSLTISVRFDYAENQAQPSGKDDKRFVSFNLFSMYNVMDKTGKKAYSKGKGNGKKVLALPLPGHMGMSFKDLEECGLKRITGIMARNEYNREQDELPEPKVVRWDKQQIGALLANELMHFYEFERKGAYLGGGGPKVLDGIYLGNQKAVWDFKLSLNEDTWYSDITTANHIMQALYYQRIFWESLKPKK